MSHTHQADAARRPGDRPQDGGFTLIEILVSMLLLSIGLFAILALVDTGNNATAKTAKRDTANSILREAGERTRGLTYAQLVAANAVNTLSANMVTPGTTTSADPNIANAFLVTRGTTTYRVTMDRSTTTSTTCGTVDAAPGTILLVGPGACGYPADGQPVYHGPTGEASGCKVGVQQDPSDLTPGAIGLKIYLLGATVPLCTAQLLGQATANAICSLVGQSTALLNLLEVAAGRDGLLSILGAGTLGISVDLCKRSGTPGYVTNPPVIDLSSASTRGPETGETRTVLTVSWVSGHQKDGSDIRTEIRQSAVTRQSTVPGES